MKPGATGQRKGFQEAQDGGRARVGPVGTVLAVVLAIMGLGLIAGGSQFPYRANQDGESLLRLSWRLRGHESEECRPMSAEELERLPIHMRNPDACQGRVLPYLLTVTVDGELVTQREFSPAGVRGNRPIYVLEDVPVAAGALSVDVRFEQVSADEGAADGASETLTLSTRMTLEPGQIGLISYDRDVDALVQLAPNR